MPIINHPQTRYKVLDDCLANSGRNYTLEDLLKTVNAKLREIDPDREGIKVRQLQKDMRFMRSPEGFDAPIRSKKQGNKHYHFYEDPKFSIRKRTVDPKEAKQLFSALKIMERFDGLPQFDWIGEITTRIKEEFSLLEDTPGKVISYENNDFYTGRVHIPILFAAIVDKKVLKVAYKPFDEQEDEITFHPYYLRQFNNRWFVLGYNEEKKIETWNLALDRIEDIKTTENSQKPSNTNWEDHFDEIVGVTRPKEKAAEEVTLIFSAEQAPYIRTKPIHPTQKPAHTTEDGRTQIRIEVVPNYELEMLILSFGEKVEVVGPKSLRKRIAERVQKMSENY